MPVIPPPSLPLSQIGRAAQDLGIAGLLGGNLFGRVAMHPSVTRISDPEERGAVVNAAWRRYGTVNSLSIVALTAGWLGARLNEAADVRLSPAERRLARAKDVLVGATAVTGIASAVQGISFSRMAPGGAVPLRDGDHAAESATPAARAGKSRTRVLGTLSLVSEVALVAVNAALAQQNFRRPPVRRMLPWVGRV